MVNKTFFNFIVWYFKYTNDNLYKKPKSGRYITKKERLGLVISAYLLFFSSWLVLFLEIKGNYLLFCIPNIIYIVLLFLTRFSLIYYMILYLKSKKINRSLNDKVIIEECILYKCSEDFRNVINQYFKIVNVRGTIFTMKYYLFYKSKNVNSKSYKKYSILKLKSNKIYLNGEKISNKRLINISEFDDLLSNLK